MKESFVMSDSTVNISPLRKMLRRFNEDLSQFINAEERYKLGRVLTIIDASISDPEQRKAIKNLVNSEWWGNGNARPSENLMQNPHTDLNAICTALGFELYEDTAVPNPSSSYEWIVKRYEKVSKED